MTTDRLMSYRNLIEVLENNQNAAHGITFIEGKDNERYVSYHNLYHRALRILYNLQNRGLKPGDELVFQVADNFDFVSIFWASFLGGIIPVPLTVADANWRRLKLFQVLGTLNNPFLVILKSDLHALAQFSEEKNLNAVFGKMQKKIILLEEIDQDSGEGKLHFPKESDLAFIQFSSGSTSDPKGVMLTHGNVLANTRAIIKGLKSPEKGDSMIAWMPLTHDMGLTIFHLTPTVACWDHFLMPPSLFIRHPLLWLDVISKYGITIGGSPNFGCKHVLKFIKTDSNATWNLSLLRAIVNGAEPISAEVCRQFFDRLACFGLKRTAMLPTYGLAEATVVVTFTEPETEIVEVTVERHSLNIGERIKESDQNSIGTVTFVEVGSPVGNLVKVTDENGVEMGDRVVGHVLIKGENVTSGYYNNREATARAFNGDGWLDTGDLGFFRNGRLVITGRAKDVIFVNGVNYYSHDLEYLCEELEEYILSVNKIAVCGIYNPERQTDEVVCFVVFRNKKSEEFIPLAQAIKKHLTQKAGVGITQVVPVKQIPVTTSGKIQRSKLREAYQKGEFDKIIEELSLYSSKID